jgi:hypothetical protein
MSHVFSFSSGTKTGGYPILWSPTRTGNYATDNATGSAAADELVSSMNETMFTPALGAIVQSIAAGGQWDGVEIGFFSRIASYTIS